MKSMKLTKSEAENAGPEVAAPETPAYPWGLRIELNDESMKKLGLEKLPGVGDSMILEAKVVVDRVSQNDTKEGGPRQDMSLQITEMDLSASGDAKTATEKKLYNTD